MPLRPLIISHDIVPMGPFTTGGLAELDEPTGFMCAIGANYGNEGNDSVPPTVSYINEVDDTETGEPGTFGTKISAMLPLSAEGVLIAPEGHIQYRHPRWSRY